MSSTTDLNILLRKSSESSLLNHSTPSLSELVKQNETRNKIYKDRSNMSVSSITSLSVMRADNPNYNLGNNNINRINRSNSLSQAILNSNPPLPPISFASNEEAVPPIWYPGKSASPPLPDNVYMTNTNEKLSFNNTSKKYTYDTEAEQRAASKFMRDYLKDRQTNILDMNDISDQPGMDNNHKYSFKTIGVAEDFVYNISYLAFLIFRKIEFFKCHKIYQRG